jgi:hypothetical protein
MYHLGCFSYTPTSGTGTGTAVCTTIQQNCGSYTTNTNDCNNAPKHTNHPNGIINIIS